MDGKPLPKGTVVKETIERVIVIGGDDSSESIPLQSLSKPQPCSDNPVGSTFNERKKELSEAQPCSDNPVGSTTNERKKELSEELWGDVSLKCLLF